MRRVIETEPQYWYAVWSIVSEEDGKSVPTTQSREFDSKEDLLSDIEHGFVPDTALVFQGRFHTVNVVKRFELELVPGTETD